MVARIPTAQVHRPCDGDAVVGVGDANRQRECPGDVTPHAQAFHRGNANRVKPPFPGARQNSSERAKHWSFDSSFSSLPSVAFSGPQADRRIRTEANKGNEELDLGQEGESGSTGCRITEYIMGRLDTFSPNAQQSPFCEYFCHEPLLSSSAIGAPFAEPRSV